VVEKKAVISIESYLGDRMGRLKFAVKKLSHLAKIIQISSVYELTERAEVSRSISLGISPGDRWAGGLCVSISILWNQSPQALLSFLQSVEHQTNSTTRCVDIDLLFFGEMSCISPELTLPHPEMHRRPQILIPAAEIFGDHVHPVLNESLRDLTARFQRTKWGQFYSAGHTLLDF
jgi:2-amino-4-hydroxy-6-hydroxymethyldihydropteridine diphosphokinase